MFSISELPEHFQGSGRRDLGQGRKIHKISLKHLRAPKKLGSAQKTSSITIGVNQRNIGAK
jgi:hypothetical protein